MQPINKLNLYALTDKEVEILKNFNARYRPTDDPKFAAMCDRFMGDTNLYDHLDFILYHDNGMSNLVEVLAKTGRLPGFLEKAGQHGVLITELTPSHFDAIEDIIRPIVDNTHTGEPGYKEAINMWQSFIDFREFAYEFMNKSGTFLRSTKGET